jgi:hypothetical protein
MIVAPGGRTCGTRTGPRVHVAIFQAATAPIAYPATSSISIADAMIRALTATLLLVPAFTFAQASARVAALDWMSGTWVQHAEGKERVAESWLGPGNGLMVAVNLTTWPSGKKSYEFLRIADTAEGFSYFASPGGKSPVEFKVKETGDKRVVFENPAHDFPQRIFYWRDGEHLVARIEGSIKGKERSEEWRFSRER